MKAIWKRELASYFKGPIGYIVTAVFVFLLGFFASSIHFSGGMNAFEYTLYNACFLYLILVPLLTMRSVAEDRKQKTDRLLMSLPLSAGKIVLGKYFAMLTVLAVPLFLTAPIPLILELYGEVNLTLAYASLLGFYLLGCALIALGLFISSFTENQIVAAVISLVVTVAAYFMGNLSQLLSTSAESSMIAFILLTLAAGAILYALTKKIVSVLVLWVVVMAVLLTLYFASPDLLEGSFQAMISSIGLFDRFYYFVNGILDLQSIVYYCSVCFLFVYFTVLSVEKRRWS